MPYFAVIVDSFRAATKSKVLWVACFAIWVLLALLAPSGTRETLTTDFSSMDLQNATRLKAVLADGLVNPDAAGTATGRIAAALPEEIKTRLRRVGDGEDERLRYSELTGALTELLDANRGGDDDWYDESVWQGLRQTAEAELLANQDTPLSDDQQRRLRRLRIVAAIPGVFGARTPTSLRPTYAGVDFPYDLPLDRKRFVTIVNQLVLPQIISWLLGFVLIFLGIVVTAPIIPGMLQPGSLHLLLSKPISRTGLLLAKFVGGCAFVLLCVSQLVIGLYLILGFRLDVWNVRLLWCIPASVLLFSVFYCVSVAAGLIFRSEVLSIGVTCCFGAVCLVTGVIGGVFDNFVTSPDKITSLTKIDDFYVAKTVGGPLQWFDKGFDQWIELTPDVSRSDLVFDPLVAPTPRGDRLLAAVSRGGRFNAYGFGAVELMVWSPPTESGQPWDLTPGVRLPAATTGLIRWRDDLVAISSIGLSIIPVADAITNDEQDEPSNAPEKEDSAGSGNWLGKLSRMMGGDDGPFRPILPPGLTISPPSRVVANADAIWIGTGSNLYRIEPTADPRSRWTTAAQTQTSGDPAVRFSMQISGDRLCHVRSGNDVQLFDSETLAEIATTPMPVDATVQSIAPATPFNAAEPVNAAEPDGGFYLVLTDGSTWRLDRDAAWQPLAITKASAVTTDDGGAAVFANRIDQVVSLSPSGAGQFVEAKPVLDVWRKVDRYVVSPLRFVVPQTGELGDVIASSISGRSEVLMGDPSSEQTRVARYQWFRPLVSCCGFIFVVMSLNIVFFRTRDF